METKNRATIKKLVHHQLLGRGYEKKDEDYIASFSAACSGTAIALRKTLAVMPIDRAKAAALVTKQLDMYLPAQGDEVGASGSIELPTRKEVAVEVKVEAPIAEA